MPMLSQQIYKVSYIDSYMDIKTVDELLHLG